MPLSKQKNKYSKCMKKNANLLVICFIGLIMFCFYLISMCSKKEETQIVANETVSEVKKPYVNKIKSYRNEHLKETPVLPEETPTDEGFLSIMGEDSVELCTDILSGRPYRIIIEGSRRDHPFQLLNEEGDSTEWDYATQVLRFQNDTMFMARLMVGENVFPFGISEQLDSIPEKGFCDLSFAEIVNNSKDSIHSGNTKFPVLGSATILFHTASEQADRLYLKVKQPGLLSVTVVYDPEVCGYPLFWDNDSIPFQDFEDEEVPQDTNENSIKEMIVRNE